MSNHTLEKGSSMSKLLKRLLIVALVVPTLAMAQQVNLDSVVATVAGQPVTAQEVQEQITTNVAVAAQQAKAAGKKFNLTKAQQEEVKQASFNEVIQNRLMVNKAKNLGINVSDADISKALNNIAQSQGVTLDQFKNAVVKQGGEKGWAALNRDLRTDMIKEALIKREVEDKVTVSSAEIDEFLSAKKLGKNNPIPSAKGIEVEDIFVAGTDAAAKKKIQAAKARLDKGEAFEAVLRDTAEPEVAANGGKTVVTLDASVDANVRKAVEGISVGTVSNVVQTKNGFHIFKVGQAVDLKFSLADQEKTARAALMEQKVPAAYEAWMKNLYETSKELVKIKE